MWFARSHGRDISAAIHAYHPNDNLCMEILKKYETNVPLVDVWDKTLNVPPFL
jgi:hypothetical protein